MRQILKLLLIALAMAAAPTMSTFATVKITVYSNEVLDKVKEADDISTSQVDSAKQTEAPSKTPA